MLALTCWAWLLGQYREAPCTAPGAFPVTPPLRPVVVDFTVTPPPPRPRAAELELLATPLRRQPVYRLELEPAIPATGWRMYDSWARPGRARAYAWVLLPHLLDQVSSELCFAASGPRVRCYELHPWGQTRGARLLKGAAVTIAAAEFCHWLERKPGWARRVPRYILAGGSLLVASRNVWLAEKVRGRN